MRTINWHLDIGFHGAAVDDTLTIDDDATAEDIERQVREAAWNHIEIWWEEVE